MKTEDKATPALVYTTNQIEDTVAQLWNLRYQLAALATRLGVPEDVKKVCGDMVEPGEPEITHLNTLESISRSLTSLHKELTETTSKLTELI